MSEYIHDDKITGENEIARLTKQGRNKFGTTMQNYIYSKNLVALGKHHPELMEMIDLLPIDENRIKIFSSESGNPRIVYKKEDGEEINIHSAEDPSVCANQAIDLLGKIDTEGIVVLFGFGFGYFAEEVFRKFDKGHFLLVYEAIPEIFKLALMTRDFSELLDSEKVKIVLGGDADNFSVIHSHHHLISNGKFWIVQHKPSVMLDQDAYDNFLKRLDEEKRLSDLGIATVIGRGKEFIDAFLENVPSIIRRPGAIKLKDVFSGRPAVIVSAGPSLDRNMHLLKKIKGKAVIVATDASIPTLVSAGIVPDIAVAIDPVKDNISDKFRDIPALKDLPFVCLAQYTPEIIRMYPGHLFVNSVPHNIAYQWLSQYWEDKGYIESFGGSVAHLAFAAAEFMGADVIAFLGQDLSYTGDRIHTIGYSDNLDRTLEKSSGESANAVPGYMTAVDIFNDTVHTIRQFTAFKTSFENKIKNYNGKVINITEAGLPIDGAENMRFLDFIKEYCEQFQDIDTYSILSGISDRGTSYNIAGLIREVTLARKKYIEIQMSSKKILNHIKKLTSLKNDGRKDSGEFHNILARVGKLIEKVKHPVLDILCGYHYGLELYLKKQKTQDIDEIEDKWERLEKQLERGTIYYSEVVKAIKLFNKQLDRLIETLNREKDIDAILNNNKMEEKERYYRAAMICKRNNMTEQAARYIEKIRNLQWAADKKLEISISLAEIYMKQFRYNEAHELLSGSMGKDVKARHEDKIADMLKKCSRKIVEWETRKKKMSEVLKEAEANYGSNLESGYFYFRIKDLERAEKAYLKAIAGRQEQLSSAYYGLAHTYLAKDDPEKAVDALGKAIEEEPDNPVFYRDLGFISVHNNNIASAEMFFTKAIELSPRTAELYKPLADLYLSMDEREKAVALYEKAMKANPDDPLIQNELAMVLNETISAAGTC